MTLRELIFSVDSEQYSDSKFLCKNKKVFNWLFGLSHLFGYKMATKI